MKTITIKTQVSQVSDEQYAMIKAGLKAGWTQFGIIDSAVMAINEKFNIEQDWGGVDASEEEVKIFQKEYKRIMKMLSKKK